MLLVPKWPPGEALKPVGKGRGWAAPSQPRPRGSRGAGTGHAGPREEGRPGRLLRPEVQPSSSAVTSLRGEELGSAGASRASKLLGENILGPDRSLQEKGILAMLKPNSQASQGTRGPS